MKCCQGRSVRNNAWLRFFSYSQLSLKVEGHSNNVWRPRRRLLSSRAEAKELGLRGRYESRRRNAGCLKVLVDKYELKNRGRLGFGPNDVRTIDILGRVTELTQKEITWRGDPRHFDLLQEYFGMDDKTKVLTRMVMRATRSRVSCERRSCRWRSVRSSGCLRLA